VTNLRDGDASEQTTDEEKEKEKKTEKNSASRKTAVEPPGRIYKANARAMCIARNYSRTDKCERVKHLRALHTVTRKTFGVDVALP